MEPRAGEGSSLAEHILCPRDQQAHAQVQLAPDQVPAA